MSPGGRPNVGPNRHAAVGAACMPRQISMLDAMPASLAPPKMPTLVRWPCFLGDSESNFLRTLLLASFFHKHAVISHLVWGTKHIILPVCFGWCLDHRPTRGAIYRVSLGVNGRVPFISSNLGDQDGDPGGKNGTYSYLLLHLSHLLKQGFHKYSPLGGL